MKLGELAWLNGNLAWIRFNFQWLKTDLSKYTARKGEWLIQNHCLKGYGNMDSIYGKLMMHYKVSRRQIFGTTATWWKKGWKLDDLIGTCCASISNCKLHTSALMESKLKGNMNGILTQWHGQKFMNLIWFILVLRAHDSYSSSEIIMPQKKSFEIEENYAITDNVKRSVRKSLSLFFFSSNY